MKLGKWAIPQAPRCRIKRDAEPKPRNDWCENDGKCDECLTAKNHKEEVP